MRRLTVLSLILLLGLLTVTACNTGDRVTNNTTVTITGPFDRCTVIILPSGRGVQFGQDGVSVRDGNTITVGGVTYNVDLTSCHATTTTTTTSG